MDTRQQRYLLFIKILIFIPCKCIFYFSTLYSLNVCYWLINKYSLGMFPDLLATSGDYLRVWRAAEPETRLECVLNNNKNSDFCAPLTSFDWNEVDPNLIGTSSIDTTCTIWGLETGQVLGRVNMVTGHVKTQLIAHDKEVYDIAFSRAGGGRDMFASVGADGSVRMFDLRHLEHSTIIYEDPQHTPLLRLAWNKQDPNYLATVAMDACEVIILDVRVPCTPVARLNNHRLIMKLFKYLFFFI